MLQLLLLPIGFNVKELQKVPLPFMSGLLIYPVPIGKLPFVLKVASMHTSVCLIPTPNNGPTFKLSFCRLEQ
jgi:hypothetical protein